MWVPVKKLVFYSIGTLLLMSQMNSCLFFTAELKCPQEAESIILQEHHPCFCGFTHHTASFCLHLPLLTDCQALLSNICIFSCFYGSFSGGSDGKEPACNMGDPGLIPGLGRSPWDGNGNSLQYFCLENSMGRRAWWAIVHGVTSSQTQLSD